MEQSIAIDLQMNILEHAPMLIAATQLVADVDWLVTSLAIGNPGF